MSYLLLLLFQILPILNSKPITYLEFIVKILFYLLVTTRNNLPLRIYCENVVNVAFLIKHNYDRLMYIDGINYPILP